MYFLVTVRTTTGETPGCKGGPMEYAWWRDLFLVIAVVRFGLVMGVETWGGGVTCERSCGKEMGRICLGTVGRWV